jgi:hypothetical protein
MPADRTVNQRQKRNMLPSVELLRSAKERIKDWWTAGYFDSGDDRLKGRFMIEARASLPGADREETPLDELIDAMELLQVRLHLDQQVRVWDPASDAAH